MECQVAKLEAAVVHIQCDIGSIKSDVRTLRDSARSHLRILVGALIAVGLGLAGMMACGFHWL
jgi:hypothetical protein